MDHGGEPIETPQEPRALVRAVDRPRRRHRQVAALLAVTSGTAAAVGAVGALALLAGRTPSVVIVEAVLPQAPMTPAAPVRPPDVVSPPAAEPAIADSGLAAGTWVLQHDTPMLLLETGVEMPDHTGTVHDDQGAVLLKRDVPENVAGPYAAKFAGKMFELYDISGVVCRATVGKVQYVGHYLDYEAPASASDGWEHASPSLVAVLKPVRGDCSKATWARDASLPPVLSARVKDASAATVARARGAMAELSMFQKIQRDYREEYKKDQVWLDDEGTTVTVSRVSNQASGESLVVIAAESAGCGEFYGTMSAVYRDTGDRLVLVSSSEQPLYVLAAADINGDGHTDLFSNEYALEKILLYSSNGTHERRLPLSTPIHVCRC